MDSNKYHTSTTTVRHSKVVFLIITCSFFFFIVQAYALNSETKKKMPTVNMNNIIDAVKTLFSLPTTFDCWMLQVKTRFFQQGIRRYFSAPAFDSGGGGMIGSSTEKVKEAAIKSFDDSKTTVEDSAKSAAKLAEEAVDTTVKKLKKTLSGSREKKTTAHRENEF